MWTTTLRYHGDGGISLAIFLVRHGASKPEAMFFPRIPPKTLRGKPTNNQTNMMRNIVVNGNACTASNVIRDENYRGRRIYTWVLRWYQATELTRLQIKKNGTAKRLADSMMFQTQPCPPILRNMLDDTKPHTPEVKA